jgi:cytidine deaminase
MTADEAVVLNDQERRALGLARAAQKNAHAPYSGKQVGAAVITRDGLIFAGCNVENGADDLDICAEHNAITSAVTAGERSYDTIIVIAPDERFWPPCASCRRVIEEFSPDAQILMSSCDGRLHRARLEQLGTKPFVVGEAGATT